ncbi:MAG: hypothetical protein GY705_29775 [Bacteroidetes bacterium]|nr:hypothetical protein [Bacteroidota bacterium]
MDDEIATGSGTQNLTTIGSTHTQLPEKFKHDQTNDDPFEEAEQVATANITVKHLTTYKIYPFHDEKDLPNFVHATNALQYFKVLRDILFDWTRSKHHQKTIIDSASSDITPQV